jgi:hypothetical protein
MTLSINHDFASNFATIHPFSSILNFMIPAANFESNPSSFAFTNPLATALNVKSIIQYQILDQYRCKSLVGPAILSNANQVIAPNPNPAVNKYMVGSSALIKVVDDFVAMICSAGSSTLTYILTSIPSGLTSEITFTKVNGKLNFRLFTENVSKVGIYDLVIRASIPSGEFAEYSIRYQVSTDCK